MVSKRTENLPCKNCCLSSVTYYMMENLCQRSLTDYKLLDGEITGYIDGCYADVESLLHNLKSIGYTFSVRDSRQGKTTTRVTSLTGLCSVACDHDYNMRCFEPAVKFDTASGLPYFIGRTIYMRCVHGPKYYKASISKKKEEEEQTAEKKIKFRNKPSKKLGCPATLVVKERHLFNEEIYSGASLKTRWQKDKIAQDLRLRLNSDNVPSTIARYFISITVDHNHPITQPRNCKKQVKARHKTSNDESGESDITVGDGSRKVLILKSLQGSSFSVIPEAVRSSTVADISSVVQTYCIPILEDSDTQQPQTEDTVDAKTIAEQTDLEDMQKSIREVLKEAMDLTYNCEDESSIKDALEMSLAIKEVLQRGQFVGMSAV